MVIDDLRSVFAHWTAPDLAVQGIGFKENFEPSYDPRRDDYRVVYEVSFTPEQLHKAQLEFALTDSGHVSVGIETYARLAKRLSLRIGRRGVAAGREPCAVTRDALVRLFQVVSRGQFVMTVNAPFGFITSPRLHVPESQFAAISGLGYSTNRWLQAIPEESRAVDSRGWNKVLLFEPW